jgi:hypothetical protein
MSARLAASALPERASRAPYEDVVDEDVADGVSLGVPPTVVPPPSLPVSPPESVGVAVGLTEPVPVGVVVGVAVGVGDVAVAVGVGDVPVAVGVGDVALAVGVADTVGDGVGLAVEVAPAHDGDGVGDGVAEVTEPVAAGFLEPSCLAQSTMRDGGQSPEGAGLADAAPLDVTAPGPVDAP